MAEDTLDDSELAALVAERAYEMAVEHKSYLVAVGARCQLLLSEHSRKSAQECVGELGMIRTDMSTWASAWDVSTEEREKAEQHYEAACRFLDMPVEPLR